jgi:hypothetical protein
MPSPWITAAIQLTSGAWCGLLVGLVSGDWSHAVTAAVIYGVVMACLTPAALVCPAGSISENWEELTTRERRMIVRALSRAEVVEQRTLTTLTIRAAESLAAEPRRTKWFEALRLAAAPAVVVVAAVAGAPPAWVIAGAAFPTFLLAIALYDRSDSIRERARQAAEANRARLAPPEGVPAGVRGVRA